MNALALPELAQAIDREHQAAHQAARTAIAHAIECGRLLLEAKDQVQHGEWLPWLEANTTVSARQSQRYMRLAAAALEGKYDATSHLTIEGALKALAAPRETEPAWPEPELTGVIRLAAWPGSSPWGAIVWVRNGKIEGISCESEPHNDTMEAMNRAHEALARIKEVGPEQWMRESEGRP